MTSPLPPTPTITAPPATPAQPPPVTVTTTATVLVPPPEVNITNPPADSGPDGWAVPIATLIAALIAATFLSINEALKRRREDRRQWDREIRDYCAQLFTLADEVTSLCLDLAELKYVERERANVWSRRTRKQLDDDLIRKENDIGQVISRIQLAVESLRVIASFGTVNAAEELLREAEGYLVFTEMDSGDEAGQESIAAAGLHLSEAKDTLLAACKREIRISRVGPSAERHGTLIIFSTVYRRMSDPVRRRAHRLFSATWLRRRHKAKARKAYQAKKLDDALR